MVASTAPSPRRIGPLLIRRTRSLSSLLSTASAVPFALNRIAVAVQARGLSMLRDPKRLSRRGWQSMVMVRRSGILNPVSPTRRLMWISPAVDATAISESEGDMARAVIAAAERLSPAIVKLRGRMLSHSSEIEGQALLQALPDRRNDLGDGITLGGISGEGAVGAAHGVVHRDREIARDAALGKEPHGGAVAATAQQHVVAAECDDPEGFELTHHLVGHGVANARVVDRPACAGFKIIAGDRFPSLDDSRPSAVREPHVGMLAGAVVGSPWFPERSPSTRCNIAARSAWRRTRRRPRARPNRPSIRAGADGRSRRNRGSRGHSRLRLRRARGRRRRPCRCCGG